MYKTFNEFLKNYKYYGIWYSKNTYDNTDRDGTAIFYPTALYNHITYNNIPLGIKSTQNGVYIHLENKLTKLDFLVCGVHLKAKPPFSTQRLEQVTILIDHLNKLDVENILLVGDFNDIPTSKCIKYVEQMGFTSVYSILDHPPTTAKIRKDLVIRCIDYIHIKGPMWGNITVKELPQLDDYAPNYLPHKNHPSDHLILGAKISFN